MGFTNKNINSNKSFFRTIILSTLGTLRESIKIDSLKDSLNIVPIFFSLTGDERYLQDKFLDWMSEECQLECKKAEGNYDPIPRGVLLMESSSIVTESLRNPHIRMERNVEKNGDISAYNTYVKWIPFVINFKLEFIFDTMLDCLLIKEQLIENFYKFKTFRTYWKGINIQSCLQFPEDSNIDKTFEFSGGDDSKNKMEVSLELETYMPVFDKINDRFEGNKMKSFNVKYNGVSESSEIISVPSDDIVKNYFNINCEFNSIFSDDLVNEVVGTMKISWDNNGWIQNQSTLTLDFNLNNIITLEKLDNSIDIDVDNPLKIIIKNSNSINNEIIIIVKFQTLSGAYGQLYSYGISNFENIKNYWYCVSNTGDMVEINN